jgi:hypothetical protein
MIWTVTGSSLVTSPAGGAGVAALRTAVARHGIVGGVKWWVVHRHDSPLDDPAGAMYDDGRAHAGSLPR